MDIRQQLEEWVIGKVEPLKHESRIVLRDPQRMIRKDARAVDGWADTRGFNVLVCSGNISFREWYESLRDDKNIKLLLVNQSRNKLQISKQTGTSVFYPDFEAETKQKARLHITLKDFLINATDDSRWPEMVNERNLSRFILDYLDGIIVAYKYLRRVDESRFTDADLSKIILGAMLDIDPFRKPSPAEIRRLCIEQFDRLEEARRMLPGDVTKILIQSIEGSEPPFCWLLKRDPDNVIRAFTLSLVINQYDNLEPQLLIANFDSSLAEFRDISKKTLERAGRELIEADPDRLISDVADMEKFLLENPERAKLMFGDLLKIHDHKNAGFSRQKNFLP